MNRLLALLLFIPLMAFGQGTTIRSLNGFGTNVTLRGILTNSTTVMTGGWVITNFNTGVVGTFAPAGISLATGGADTFIATTASGNVSFTGVASGNGLGLTNILERNIVVTTNIMGTALVNFGNGTQVATNMSGDITFTGISGFVTSNLNWQAIDLNPNGAVRLITVPADWWVSGFTNNTVVAIPSAAWAKLRVEALIGRCTNASIEIYQ